MEETPRRLTDYAEKFGYIRACHRSLREQVTRATTLLRDGDAALALIVLDDASRMQEMHARLHPELGEAV